MVADVPLAQVRDVPVESWSVVDGQLRLRLGGRPEERALRCTCGRCHWILETRIREGRGVLAVRCHTCGTSRELVLQEFRIPPR